MQQPYTVKVAIGAEDARKSGHAEELRAPGDFRTRALTCVTAMYGSTYYHHHMHGCLRLRTAKAATPQVSVRSTMDLRDHVGPPTPFLPRTNLLQPRTNLLQLYMGYFR